MSGIAILSKKIVGGTSNRTLVPESSKIVSLYQQFNLREKGFRVRLGVS